MEIKKILQIAFAILFLTMLWNIPYKEIRIERMRAFGEKKAIGTVVYRKTSNNGEKKYYIAYTFVGPDGNPKNKIAVVQKQTWNSYLGGDPIEVIYPPAAPDLSRIKGEVESPFVSFLADFSRTIQ
ncbi:DUF3592 domain-containing protein [Maridesulfovibrio bastinii]|jgi:hypothetical protein|uniref:DUF3592 domain-containing protein n=1 Tax=Maridesulfovibrio bastinii TaxID=47157 RepID=UPI00040E02D8|nr:DUF3592 domain-containing protein [Maridesulfovibrio bastinii]